MTDLGNSPLPDPLPPTLYPSFSAALIVITGTVYTWLLANVNDLDKRRWILVANVNDLDKRRRILVANVNDLDKRRCITSV